VIGLRPLREDEYPAWEDAHRAEYARGMAAYAGITQEAAEVKAARDLPLVLPDGLATEGARIWSIEADGRPVGTIFLGLRAEGPWLYDITIDEAERGKGYGRAAMLALEEEARRLGHDGIGLNVWGGNDVARGLYRSLGYVEQSVHMRKPLSS
jgi:GNAT superfamily N-acetyltransferase